MKGLLGTGGAGRNLVGKRLYSGIVWPCRGGRLEWLPAVPLTLAC